MSVNKPSGNRNQAIDALSLHSFERVKPKDIDKRIESVRERVFPPHLYIPHPKVSRSPSPKTEEQTMEEVDGTIKALIDELSVERDYNGLHPLVKLLADFEERPEDKECIIAHEFALTCSDEPASGGSTCVGRSREVVDILSKKFGLDARMTYETKKEHSPIEHAAAVVLCKDGILLIDILNPPESRIVHIPYGKETDSPMGKYKCNGPVKEGEHFSIEKRSSEGTFEVLNIDNGDAVVMSKYLFRRHLYPIVCYKDNKPHRVVKVNPTEQEVVLQEGSGKGQQTLHKFSFDEITSNPAKLQSSLDDFMSGSFKTSSDLAMKQVTLICRLNHHLEEFYNQIHAPRFR